MRSCAPSEQQLCRPGAQLRMGVVTQIGDLDNTSTRVRPYGVKVRFGLFARLQVRRTVWINRIFQCDRRGGTAVAQTPSVPLLGGRNPRGLPFAALRQNDRGKPCHYNAEERLNGISYAAALQIRCGQRPPTIFHFQFSI